MKNIKALLLTVLIFSIGNVVAKEHNVKMLNGKAPDIFVFEPAVINIKKKL